jgi:hypothetical protein
MIIPIVLSEFAELKKRQEGRLNQSESLLSKNIGAT